MKQFYTYKFKQQVDFEFPNLTDLAKKTMLQVLFGLVFMLFFFNFFTVKCGGKEIVSVSGINMVIGTNVSKQLTSNLSEIEDLKSFDEFGNIIQSDAIDVPEEDGAVAPNFFAILSISCVLISLVLYFFKSKRVNRLAAILSLTALASLIILRLSIGSNLIGNTNDMVHIFIESNFAYWLALFFLCLATIFAFVRWRQEEMY